MLSIYLTDGQRRVGLNKENGVTFSDQAVPTGGMALYSFPRFTTYVKSTEEKWEMIWLVKMPGGRGYSHIMGYIGMCRRIAGYSF